jgi:hypothetical protein
MPRREHTAKVGIAGRCFGEENSSVRTMNQFRTEDRLQSSLSCQVEKPNRSIQSVRVGEGQCVLALFLYSPAERFQRWDSLHWGIGGMGM